VGSIGCKWLSPLRMAVMANAGKQATHY
jgi:hypothetical protein